MGEQKYTRGYATITQVFSLGNEHDGQWRLRVDLYADATLDYERPVEELTEYAHSQGDAFVYASNIATGHNLQSLVVTLTRPVA